MERIEYFAQEIKQKHEKSKQEDEESVTKIEVVRDQLLWQITYEEVARRAWRAFDIANIGA